MSASALCLQTSRSSTVSPFLAATPSSAPVESGTDALPRSSSVGLTVGVGVFVALSIVVAAVIARRTGTTKEDVPPKGITSPYTAHACFIPTFVPSADCSDRASYDSMEQVLPQWRYSSLSVSPLPRVLSVASTKPLPALVLLTIAMCVCVGGAPGWLHQCRNGRNINVTGSQRHNGSRADPAGSAVCHH